MSPVYLTPQLYFLLCKAAALARGFRGLMPRRDRHAHQLMKTQVKNGTEYLASDGTEYFEAKPKRFIAEVNPLTKEITHRPIPVPWVRISNKPRHPGRARRTRLQENRATA